MPVFPSFTKQLWAITSNTDVRDNKYKNKWGQQETVPSPNLHTPSSLQCLHSTAACTGHPTTHLPGDLKSWGQVTAENLTVPQMNQYCLKLTPLLDWNSCFVLLQTTTNYLIWSIRCHISCNLLENRFYCVISTTLKINQHSVHCQRNNHCKILIWNKGLEKLFGKATELLCLNLPSLTRSRYSAILICLLPSHSHQLSEQQDS